MRFFFRIGRANKPPCQENTEQRDYECNNREEQSFCIIKKMNLSISEETGKDCKEYERKNLLFPTIGKGKHCPEECAECRDADK